MSDTRSGTEADLEGHMDKLDRARRTGRGLRILGGASAAALLITSPVVGKQLEQFSFTDERQEVRTDFCGVTGLDVLWHRVERGTVLLIARGPDGLPHAQGSFQGSATYTNLATGKEVTFRWNSMDKSHRIVDNGDGTSTEIVQVSGDRSWWSGGRRIAPDTGTFRLEVLVDNGGTPTDPSDDAFIDAVEVTQASTGRNDAQGFDLCAEFTGLTT
jgi:hypothetical protein